MKAHKSLFVVLALIFALFLSATEGHTWTISAAAGADGTISPVGNLTVLDGDDQEFIITPDPGYKLSSLFVDHGFLSPISPYTFTNVTTDHFITAYFAPLETFYISANSGPNGAIAPAGNNAVTEGNSLQITITPDPDYGISDVLVDGSSVGPVPLYSFIDVTADHSISASFIITDPPNASFSVDPATGTLSVPAGVQFTDTSTLYPTYWFWDFGDGAVSNEQHPFYLYDLSGTYPVTLTVGNVLGLDTATLVGDYSVGACGNSDLIYEQSQGAFSCVIM